MFLHKAIKPARAFINLILALLWEMGTAAKAAIDEGTKRDLQWFMACAHAVNSTVSIFKSLHPQVETIVDASLTGLGGALGKFLQLINQVSHLSLHILYKNGFLLGFLGLLCISNVAPASRASFDPLRHMRRGDIMVSKTFHCHKFEMD
jgi:hypothetical protein